MEDTLIRDRAFSLPERKAPPKNDAGYEVILVDATESPIERPKNAKAAHTKSTAAYPPSDGKDHCTGIFQKTTARFERNVSLLSALSALSNSPNLTGTANAVISQPILSACFNRLSYH
ncbi:MAG: hypothetical protein HFF17_08370 [Oscillospiraceae bacterium]|nr:hypothetical protein [Oscillospiraceae bacterium]